MPSPQRPLKDELETHLAATLKGVAWPFSVQIQQGWEDRGSKLEEPAIQVEVDITERRPVREEYARTDQGSTWLVKWKTAAVTFDVVFNVYTKNRTERGRIKPLLRALFVGEPEDQISELPAPGLELTMTKHLGSKARVLLLDDDDIDDEAQRGGYYRSRWQLTADASELISYEYEKATWTDNPEVTEEEL